MRRMAGAGAAGHRRRNRQFGIRCMTETLYSLLGAALGGFLFVFAGRDPLRRLIASLRQR